MMKKIFTILTIACLALNTWAQIVEEPVVIGAPDTVINKTAYTLTEEGVTIHVSYGSAYPADHEYNNLDMTYFACLATGEMTITTERTMKGIAINGWLRKNFSATCDNGEMRSLANGYEDVIGEPVLTIFDIDSTEVTISCAGQLRCFELLVFFTENPEDPYENEYIDTVSLTMVTAEAWDYSDSLDFSTEGAYSYWLGLKPAEQYPVVWLDMYAAVKGDLSGQYSWENENVGDYTYVQLSEDELDYYFSLDQEFTITQNGDSYHIEGWLLAENDARYEFVYDGPVAIVPPHGDEEQGIADTKANANALKLLRDGQLIILRGEKEYNVLGIEL